MVTGICLGTWSDTNKNTNIAHGRRVRAVFQNHFVLIIWNQKINFDCKYAVSAAQYGSAGNLPITYAYILMMGPEGLKRATASAILSANYIADRLKNRFPVLYSGKNGRVAHECVIDIRGIQEEHGVTNEDIAKRLIDFGFHAPTMSFPVAGTLMIEPTESENIEQTPYLGIGRRHASEPVSYTHLTLPTNSEV